MATSHLQLVSSNTRTQVDVPDLSSDASRVRATSPTITTLVTPESMVLLSSIEPVWGSIKLTAETRVDDYTVSWTAVAAELEHPAIRLSTLLKFFSLLFGVAGLISIGLTLAGAGLIFNPVLAWMLVAASPFGYLMGVATDKK